MKANIACQYSGHLSRIYSFDHFYCRETGIHSQCSFICNRNSLPHFSTYTTVWLCRSVKRPTIWPAITWGPEPHSQGMTAPLHHTEYSTHHDFDAPEMIPSSTWVSFILQSPQYYRHWTHSTIQYLISFILQSPQWHWTHSTIQYLISFILQSPQCYRHWTHRTIQYQVSFILQSPQYYRWLTHSKR